MDRFRKTIAAALIGLDDSDGLLSLRFALAARKHTQHRFLRRVRKALARRLCNGPEGREKQASAPESSGIHTRCWHPLDRIARLPPNLPSYRIAEEMLRPSSEPVHVHLEDVPDFLTMRLGGGALGQPT